MTDDAPNFEPPPRDQLATVDRAEGVEYPNDLVVVEGIISPRGSGGWCGLGNYQVHSFSLAAWRFPGQPLVHRTLDMMRPVPKGSDYFAGYDICSPARFRILLEKSRDRAVVDERLPMDEVDDVLHAAAEQLRRPIVAAHARFGTMTYDWPTGFFESSASWNATWLRPRFVKVQLEADDNRSIAGTARVAEELWSAQAEWKKRIDAFAVEKLLPLKNEDWLQFWELRVSPKRFVRRMKLETIQAFADDRFTFWHRTNLFAGHYIEVRGNLQDGPTSADIPG